MEGVILGSAGCGVGEKQVCGFIRKELFGFKCLKYNINLDIHHSGKPFRAQICLDKAEKDIWSKIISDKRKGD